MHKYAVGQTLGGIAESVFTAGTGPDGKFSWGNVLKPKPKTTGMTPPFNPNAPAPGYGIG